MNTPLMRLQARINAARSFFSPSRPSPDELLGELFQDVQLRVFPDSITFTDMVPAQQLRQVLRAYKRERHDPDFDLHSFVNQHFKELLRDTSYTTNKKHTIEEHIEELWGVLQRYIPRNTGSLIGLPYPYVVAGGRYIAMYYWDSYFTMLGLAASGHWGMVENIIKDCASLIRRFGFVPNANRTYYRTRSQPPVFCLMVQLLAQHKGKKVLVKYLPYLLAEYWYWMKGHDNLKGRRTAMKHVVRMPDGSVLNRYFDNRSAPRAEGYKEDIATALSAPHRPASRVYVDLRAAAESGWDFSSRWLEDYKTLATIHTTDIIPVDLNSLLAMLENTIADAYDALLQAPLATRFRHKAQARMQAVDNYCWDKKARYYFDYNFVKRKQTDVVSCAGLFPMFAGHASSTQVSGIIDTIHSTLLKKGGLVTTDRVSGEQWDAPNGWAHFQWVAVKGLRAYGHNDVADDIKKRWLKTCDDLYKSQGKLVEKYNVVEPSRPPTNGEYPLQDGFGWTNGVYLALKREDALH